MNPRVVAKGSLPLLRTVQTLPPRGLARHPPLSRTALASCEFGRVRPCKRPRRPSLRKPCAAPAGRPSPLRHSGPSPLRSPPPQVRRSPHSARRPLRQSMHALPNSTLCAPLIFVSQPRWISYLHTRPQHPAYSSVSPSADRHKLRPTSTVCWTEPACPRLGLISIMSKLTSSSVSAIASQM
jgi:hypothetical protein